MFNSAIYEKLPASFYTSSKVVNIAKQLLGKHLFTHVNDKLTMGRIVETEAYNGRKDKASHAYQKKTPRTKIMYRSGGIAYVYLCYGMHHLFNVVTNKEGFADAVLIRALEPILGLDHMINRRGKTKKFKLTAGPGCLSQAMGIEGLLNGMSLNSEKLWIAQGLEADFEIVVDRRVSVDYADEDALLPWRFFIKDNPWISKGIQKSK
jgi:DNA-3-methyladenine glycosylase